MHRRGLLTVRIYSVSKQAGAFRVDSRPTFRTCCSIVGTRWRFDVVVALLGASTKLLYVEPG